jgi:hypothetical protein
MERRYGVAGPRRGARVHFRDGFGDRCGAVARGGLRDDRAGLRADRRKLGTVGSGGGEQAGASSRDDGIAGRASGSHCTP